MPSGEISTKAIVTDALRRGKKVFVPYIYKNKDSSPKSLMDMVSLHSEQDYESLEPDRWGIPTPDERSVSKRSRCLGEVLVGEYGKGDPKKVEPLLESLDLIVVPAVAFDAEFRRLGHGKGYYDFFLSQYYNRTGDLDCNETKMPFLGKHAQGLGRGTGDS